MPVQVLPELVLETLARHAMSFDLWVPVTKPRVPHGHVVHSFIAVQDTTAPHEPVGCRPAIDGARLLEKG